MQKMQSRSDKAVATVASVLISLAAALPLCTRLRSLLVLLLLGLHLWFINAQQLLPAVVSTKRTPKTLQMGAFQDG